MKYHGYKDFEEYKDRRSNPTKTIIFVLIGGFLIVMTDLLILGGAKHIWPEKKEVPGDVEVSILKEQHGIYMDKGIYIDSSLLSKPVAPPAQSDEMEVVDVADASSSAITIEEILAEEKAKELADINPALGVEKEIAQGFAHDSKKKLFDDVIIEAMIELEAGEEDIIDEVAEVAEEIIHYMEAEPVIEGLEQEAVSTKFEYTKPEGKGQVAIIIDDMGITLRSKQVEVMQGPLTLAYLPYAEDLKARTKRASDNGHELMVHIPMEPMNGKLDGGPKVLSASLDDTEFMNTLDWALAQFDGFVGVNNHMGSKATQDVRAMGKVMEYLKVRGDDLYFVDSKTINSSIAADTAKQTGIPHATRDVFLDHEMSAEFIEAALKQVEAIALGKKGYAIAIGHPHKNTIAALKKWLPTLEEKGLTLVPASKLINYPKSTDDNLVVSR